jgi:hypothetical protein
MDCRAIALCLVRKEACKVNVLPPISYLHHLDECINGVLWQDVEGVDQDVGLALGHAAEQGRQLLELGQGHLQVWLGNRGKAQEWSVSKYAYGEPPQSGAHV